MGRNKHVAEAHRNARNKFTEWVLCGRPSTGVMYDEMCESRMVFKSRLKWCQDHQDQLKMDTLAEKHAVGDFGSFWRGKKKCDIGTGLPVSVDGISDHKGIADAFREHFSVQPTVRSSVEAFYAEGLSGAVGFCLTSLTPHISKVLALFYCVCMGHAYLPADMLRTLVVPVVKNRTGDLADKSNYRPISLAKIVRKGIRWCA